MLHASIENIKGCVLRTFELYNCLCKCYMLYRKYKRMCIEPSSSRIVYVNVTWLYGKYKPMCIEPSSSRIGYVNVTW
jgi:hypothetical protein